MHVSVFAQTTPDKPAYIMAGTGETVTYKQLNDRSNQGAQLFRKLGLKFGDTIAIMFENNVHYLEIAIAAGRCGLYFTPISSRLSPSEAEYILENSGARVFITSPKMMGVVKEIGKLPSNVEHRYMVDDSADGYLSYETAIGELPAEPVPDEIAGGAMLYSSGTTGRPKGVRRPLKGEKITDETPGRLVFKALYGFSEETVYISPAPLYHAAPLAFNLMVLGYGGTSILMEKFDPETALQLIEKHKATHSQWVPTMFIRMLKLPKEVRTKYDVSSLKIAVHAAAPCPIPIKEQMIDWWGPVLFEYYAGSEGNGVCAIASADWLKHKGSVGRAMLGVVHITDEEGNELPPGERGMIYFADGEEYEYYNDPKKTAEAMNDKGWTTLGDVGYLDENGYLYLTDRKAFMIISGGVNVYPQETENVIVMHPKVADVAVIGVPNEEFGEEVKAVVQLMDMNDAGPEMEREIISFCREQLSHIKCPKSVDFDPELPRHPTGKLYKRLLRDRYWQGHESKLV